MPGVPSGASGRAGQKRPVCGLLLLDKPPGISSNAALQRARALYCAARAGHSGTLDPMATGLLIVCFGAATRFSQYLLASDKQYSATMRLGQRTDSGDAEGEVVEQQSAGHLTEADIEQALAPLRGDIMQKPPRLSAIKHQGVPLYRHARSGQPVDAPPRAVRVHRLELLGMERAGDFLDVRLEVSCSKGTYIRSIADDLGCALGCGGHLCALRRTASGDFRIADAHSLDALAALDCPAGRDALLLPPDRALAHLPAVTLEEADGYLHGRASRIKLPYHFGEKGCIVRTYCDGLFLGLGETADAGLVKPRRLMPAQ